MNKIYQIIYKMPGADLARAVIYAADIVSALQKFNREKPGAALVSCIK